MIFSFIIRVIFAIFFFILITQALLVVDLANEGRLSKELYQIAPFSAFQSDQKNSFSVQEARNQKLQNRYEQAKRQPRIERARLRELREKSREQQWRNKENINSLKRQQIQDNRDTLRLKELLLSQRDMLSSRP